MKVLLDTHALLWWFQEDPSLSSKARRTLAAIDNQVFVSTATVWEMAIKNRAGKLEIPELLDELDAKLVDEGMQVLPISLDHAVRAGALLSLDHAVRAGALPVHHKDPFDRMLVAQAQVENLSVISSDAIFEKYGIRRIW
ncbi:MAG TPA: type II toxin-antitoxin system VapC family toxin [Terriglobales bacterium]|nr:type II toxin-antitoxin system VapC family toxin [Terriglobales bacterium]